MAALIATVKGKLSLTIGDSEPIHLGDLEIPIEAAPGTERGELVLRAKPNMGEVRDFVEQVFGAAGRDQ